MSKQPKALELADVLDDLHRYGGIAVKPAAETLRSQHQLIGELVEAVEAYFVTYANGGKRPGWVGRVAAAESRLNATLSKAKEQQS